MFEVNDLARRAVNRSYQKSKLKPLTTKEKRARQQEIIQERYQFSHGGSKKNVKKRKKEK